MHNAPTLANKVTIHKENSISLLSQLTRPFCVQGFKLFVGAHQPGARRAIILTVFAIILNPKSNIILTPYFIILNPHFPSSLTPNSRMSAAFVFGSLALSRSG